MSQPKAKILFFDIETSPNLANVWANYEQNVLRQVESWQILCFSYRWAHERKTYVVSMYDNRKLDQEAHGLYYKDDYNVVLTLHELLEQADIVVAHNGDKFDLRKANARFVYHGLTPPEPYKTVDTLKVARKYFNFNSNKLGDLGEYLGAGSKQQSGGLETWFGCMNGDEKSWRKMIKYAKQDVNLLIKVYEKLRPWMTNHPNLNVYGALNQCPTCGHSKLTKRGIRTTKTMSYQQYRCNSCGAYSRERLSLKVDKPKLVS